MPKSTRVFEREVTLKSQGQYALPEGRSKKLRLLRWRLNIDGEDGPWKAAGTDKANGGWPETLSESDVEPRQFKN